MELFVLQASEAHAQELRGGRGVTDASDSFEAAAENVFGGGQDGLFAVRGEGVVPEQVAGALVHLVLPRQPEWRRGYWQA